MGLLTIIFQDNRDSKITPVKHLVQDLAGSKCPKVAVTVVEAAARPEPSCAAKSLKV